MNTRLSPILIKQGAASDSKRVSLLRIGAQVIDTVVSLVLALIAAVFFMWINGRKHEFDKLEDRSR